MRIIPSFIIANFILFLIAVASHASTAPIEMPISCSAPKPDKQKDLQRPRGDSNVWTFRIVPAEGVRFVTGPVWSYPGKDTSDPEWGVWAGGNDGATNLGWSSPEKTGVFSVRVSGKIVCGSGSGGEPIDFEAGWDGEVVSKHWKPEPAIEGGIMIQPQNQATNPFTPAEVLFGVDTPGSLPVEVTEATDNDTWEILDEEGEEEDEVNYKWSSTAGNFFVLSDLVTPLRELKERLGVWMPPTNSNQQRIPGDYTLTCIIDDKPTEVEEPETGKRDDEKIERQVKVVAVRVKIFPYRIALDPDEEQVYQVYVFPEKVASKIKFVDDTGLVTLSYNAGNRTLTVKANSSATPGPFQITVQSIFDDSILGRVNGRIFDPEESTPDDKLDYAWDDIEFDPNNPPSSVKVWTPVPGITGGEIVQPSGGEKTVRPGESVLLEVASASDSDRWFQGYDSGIDNNATVGYTWKDQEDHVLTADPNDPKKLSWTAPTTEGTYTVTCTISDDNPPIPAGEMGNRDDDDIVRTFVLKVEPQEPDVVVDDSIRVCAGHLNDSLHTAVIPIITKDKVSGEGMVSTLHLSFENNRGSEKSKRAKFLIGAEEVEQATITTDSEGLGSVTVISSDVISNNITVKIEWKDSQDRYKEVGTVTCDFGEAVSKRNFALDPEQVSFPSDTDNGWWFTSDVLISGGDQTVAKLYLKFDKDDDEAPVNGHTMRISIDDISLEGDGNNVSSTDYSRYIYFINSAGERLKDGEVAVQFVDVTTSTSDPNDPKSQGCATVYLKGGPLIYQAATIRLKAIDLTQIRE